MHPRILIVTDNTQDQINGVVTTFRSIEKQARANGYQIDYISPNDFKNFPAPGYPEVKLSLPIGIGRLIEDKNPDYIHIATEGPVGLMARLYCDRRGYKYNTSYHTKFPEFLKSIYGIPECITYWYVRWFHKHSGRVLTTTNTMVKDLINHGFNGEIIPWTRGVDREVLRPTKDFSHEKKIRNKVRVLYVGRISREKNIDDLCILENDFDIHLVGDGPYRHELEKKYTKVKFLGYKGGAELADCYSQADVFCFPSRVDTFGIVIIESLSLGTPVAAYPVPGPIDIIEPGINGHMSDDLAKSIRLCCHYDRERVKKSGQKWTWENCWDIFKSSLVNK